MLQCVAVCCSVWQCVAVCCMFCIVNSDVPLVSWSQDCDRLCVAVCCVTVCCSVLQFVAVCCSLLQCVAVCCSALQCEAVDKCVALLAKIYFWSHSPSAMRDCALQCVAVCCSVLQRVAA